MKNDEIKERLEKLPDKIYEKEVLLLKDSDEIEEINLKIKFLELTISNKVADETEEDGKKMFSNKEKREFETNKRLELNDEHKALTKRVKDVKSKIDGDKILISFLKRKFRSSESLARLGID